MSVISLHKSPFRSLSIAVPCFNEEANIEEIRKRLEGVLSELPLESEVVLVDDGSSDRSWKLMQRITSENSRFRAVRLSRNFGQQEALLAGLRASRGDLVVTLDADLQDPPELIPEMIETCEKGAFVVYAVRNKRDHDPALKKLFAHLFYATIRRATGLDIPSNTGEFRLARREVVEAVLNLKEARPFLRGMFAWVGFSRAYVQYERPERFAGEPKFTFAKSLGLAMDAFVSFSQLKQKLQLALGAIAFLSLLFAGTLLLMGVQFPLPLLGVAVLLVLGGQLFVNAYLDLDGRVGSYRPEYIVQEEIGEGLLERSSDGTTRAVGNN